MLCCKVNESYPALSCLPVAFEFNFAELVKFSYPGANYSALWNAQYIFQSKQSSSVKFIPNSPFQKLGRHEKRHEAAMIKRTIH